MKKVLLIIAILFTAYGFSQPITVNATSYTVPQLVNNVLINSPCSLAKNITWSTGTNFGSSNGIGYFQNTNPKFPMTSGVILSTGSLSSAPGPNTSLSNDGSPSWAGDSDLETTMAASGISMVSKNATVLEFDFTPISTYFSFDFIFASEEYGNFQCKFSDAFAFLLTDTTTGITQNLAVVPGTSEPISVVTVRDNLYNSSCPSANSQYFGSFNGGSAAMGSAINFNGQTTVLTASSKLTPNMPYHIKLVIADRLDPQSDSAIFISSNSFNIGQEVLGQDLTIANDTAVCYGSTQVINTGLDPSLYTFQWKKGNLTLSGETGPSLTISSAGTYSVTFTNINNTCLPITDTITVEYYPEIVVKNPNNIYKCNMGASSYIFDLELNNSVIKKNIDPLTTVSYHLSQSDAQNNTNPLPLQYSGNGGETIYARIQLPNEKCYTVKTFKLLLTAPPVAYKPNDLDKCSKDGSDTATFNINAQTHLVMNGQSPTIYSVSYYNTLNDANNAINPLTDLSNGERKTQTVYVRIQNDDDPTCYSITSFEITVNPGPPIDKPADVFTCVSYTLPPLKDGDYYTEANGAGIKLSAGDYITETMVVYIHNKSKGQSTCASNTSFKVTFVDKPEFAPKDVSACKSYILPKPIVGNYYTAPGGKGTLIPDGKKITTSQTIYYYYSSTTATNCIVDSSFYVTINPVVEVGTFNDVFECISYTLPNPSLGKYYTGPNGSGSELPAGTVITTSQTVYVFLAAPSPDFCSDEDDFEVFIGMPQPVDITQCNAYSLPELPIGGYFTGPKGTGQQIPAGTVINNNTTLYVYAPTASGGSNCTDDMQFNITLLQPEIDILNDVSVCESYTLPNLTKGEYFTDIAGQGTKLLPGDVILKTQTIYIFKKLDNSSCYNQVSFKVTINKLPAINSRSDIDICDQYILTPLSVGHYFTGPNGTGTKLNAGSIITSTQKIYIYATSGTNPPCVAENSFQINIFSTTAEAPANVVTCNSYVLPALSGTNKYYTQSGGPYGTGSEIAPGTVITNTQTIYVFKEALIRTAFSCTDENSFTVTINASPVIPAIADVNACKTYTLPSLTIGNYFTGPNGTGNSLSAGDIVTSSQTLYVYAHTSTTPDCSGERTFKINIFGVDALPDVTICESYTLPVLIVGNYYTGPDGTGSKLTAGTVIKTTCVIYIYGKSIYDPNCTDEKSFRIRIVKPPVAYPVSLNLRTLCDEDGVNDGITTFNLINVSDAVLGNQTGSEFSVNYYENLTDANNQINPVNNTMSSTVYSRVNNNNAPSCYDIESITIVVNKLPEPELTDGIVCLDSKTGNLLNAYNIQSELTTETHAFIWRNEDGKIIGLNQNYQAVKPGVYTVTATDKLTGCVSKPAAATVAASEPPTITYTVDGKDFSEDQSIVVSATGQGNNFEYQLDNGQFQDSPVFENVTSGHHLITVRDKNGCGVSTADAIVINYPKFFTPNGDGYHDTWNITDLAGQPEAYIIIFDRFGKMLAQIKPSDAGWDGTYNGSLMPADDFWFAVYYTDDLNAPQEFRAHFTLKR